MSGEAGESGRDIAWTRKKFKVTVDMVVHKDYEKFYDDCIICGNNVSSRFFVTIKGEYQANICWRCLKKIRKQNNDI